MSLGGLGTSAEADVNSTNSNPQNGTQMVSQLTAGFVGESIQLSEQLVLDTLATSSFLNTVPHASTADAQDTAAAFVDVVTPGATYTTASGITYFSPASPVPEPSSISLMIAAGAFVGGLVHRRLGRYRGRS